jgi:hypothetical protein
LPHVTHRIDVGRQGGTITFHIQGLLDAAALAALEASVAAARADGSSAVVVLGAGTQIDRACLPALRAMGAALSAESPYLAQWIARGDSTLLHDPEADATDGPGKVDVSPRSLGRTNRSS